MIKGIGIDHVRIERVRELLERFPDRARGRLFTAAERRACDGRKRPDECYAARFAAKEAFVKALGTGLREGMRWSHIEVETDASGQPRLRLHDAARSAFRQAGGVSAHLSFTHEAGTAAAIVIIEGPE
ncbi:MAG: holo-ACP synthase [marine benthic group bacterium]|nr:holo-ACP synthase [Candidatus Benthicola marisminoris]